MEDLGLKLKRAREERGVSLRDIAGRTKISLAALEALERSEFHRLPGGIFSRAVVRAYATEVGLDPDTTVENFLTFARRHEREAAERVAAAQPGITRDDHEFLERQQRAIRILRVVAVLVAAGAVTLLVWQARRFWAPRAAGDRAAAAAGITPEPAPALPPIATPPAPAPESSAALVAAPPRPDPAPVATRTPPDAPVEKPAGLPEPAPTVPVPADTPEAAPAAPVAASALVIEVTALADCQITVIRDDGPAESQVLRSGGRLRLEAQRDVALSVADAGAVQWRINGRPAKPLGRAGTEVSVRVTLANVTEFLP